MGHENSQNHDEDQQELVEGTAEEGEQTHVGRTRRRKRLSPLVTYGLSGTLTGLSAGFGNETKLQLDHTKEALKVSEELAGAYGDRDIAKYEYTAYPTRDNRDKMNAADARVSQAMLDSLIFMTNSPSTTNPQEIARRVGGHTAAGLGVGVLAGAVVKRRRAQEEAEDAAAAADIQVGRS